MIRVNTILILALLFLSLHTTVSAQGVVPQDGIAVYDDAARPCLIVHLDPEPKAVKKAWQDYVDDHFDIKLNGLGFLTNKDVLTAEDVFLPEISSRHINLYTRIVADRAGSEMQLLVAHGDQFIDDSTYPVEYAATRNILTDFLSMYLPEYYETMIDNTKDRISDIAKDRKQLKEDISANHKEIASLEMEIKKMSAELKQNSKDLESAQELLEEQQEKLDEVRGKLVKQASL